MSSATEEKKKRCNDRVATAAEMRGLQLSHPLSAILQPLAPILRKTNYVTNAKIPKYVVEAKLGQTCRKKGEKSGLKP